MGERVARSRVVVTGSGVAGEREKAVPSLQWPTAPSDLCLRYARRGVLRSPNAGPPRLRSRQNAKLQEPEARPGSARFSCRPLVGARGRRPDGYCMESRPRR